MIQLIGKRRIILIAALVALNSILGAAVYLYFIPQNLKKEAALREVKLQVSSRRADADRYRQEFDEIQKEKARFQSLEAQGFLSDQNRVAARKRIEDIQSYSRVLYARYDIDPGSVEDIESVVGAERILFKSPFVMTVDALDDADIYNFIHLVENAFIGHASVTSLEIERVKDVNDVTIRQIGTGTPVVLVTAKVNFDWRTFMRRDQIPGAPMPDSQRK